jgi:hypothetical protein
MSQHVSETCNESDGLWLPLTEYSVRSGVSLSTIRRKIKSNSIKYRLEKGRYLILFNDANNAAARSVPPLSAVAIPVHLPEPPRRERIPEYRMPAPAPAPAPSRLREEPDDSPLAEKAVRMISDAFEHALREKDERIRLLEKANRLLEDRLNELKLLVRVLEEKYEVRY